MGKKILHFLMPKFVTDKEAEYEILHILKEAGCDAPVEYIKINLPQKLGAQSSSSYSLEEKLEEMEKSGFIKRKNNRLWGITQKGTNRFSQIEEDRTE